jgi:hypothetical protein
LDSQWLSLQPYRLGARPTGVGNQRSYGGAHFSFREPAISVLTDRTF